LRFSKEARRALQEVVMAGVGIRVKFKLVDKTPTVVNGEHVPRQVTILRGYGDIKRKGGVRFDQYDQTTLQKIYELRFPYRSDISLNANVKLVYDGNTFSVLGIEKEKNKSFYWILTFEGKAFS
jgi:hypothetical protein